jgi:hypothetical protein
MPIISAADLGGDFTQKAASEGEHDLRIFNAKYGVSQAGNAGLTISMNIEDEIESDPPPVTAWIGEPVPNTKDYKRYMRQLQSVLKAFGWTGDFDMEANAQDLVGSTGRFALGQETDRRDGKTVVNRLQLPR